MIHYVKRVNVGQFLLWLLPSFREGVATMLEFNQLSP